LRSFDFAQDMLCARYSDPWLRRSRAESFVVNISLAPQLSNNGSILFCRRQFSKPLFGSFDLAQHVLNTIVEGNFLIANN
jgi:hypothetical protein